MDWYGNDTDTDESAVDKSLVRVKGQLCQSVHRLKTSGFFFFFYSQVSHQMRVLVGGVQSVLICSPTDWSCTDGRRSSWWRAVMRTTASAVYRDWSC